MHVIEVNANSEVKLCPASEIIGALQNNLASSRPIIPDLETLSSAAGGYSSFLVGNLKSEIITQSTVYSLCAPSPL
ncbi:hypothetical protein AZE42_11616 [Rhizopogon vesiculosus]|uniref:Uncharacterized protein n=1 Tax=Rhizopogon vesiculosus TaxID=180088 RepID=A0A1J8PSB2_9AGAM|nr:hypothetical protein AZE42_11616 [Rhizopogon vesiculosus]